MLRLQDLVNKLFEREQRPVHFWLDTLCVPLQDPFRRIAIDSMKSTYEGACKVLVVDSLLGQASAHEADVAELAMRVRVSTWGRRLWTFHEACLAQRLYYQYQDKALTLSDLHNMALEQQFNEDQEWRMLCNDKRDMFQAEIEIPIDLFMVFKRKLRLSTVENEALAWMWHQEGHHLGFWKGSSFETLSGLIDCLQHRWTSWLEDETICLSGLLGLRVEHLTSLTGIDSTATQENRMQEFLNSLDEVPADILFLQRPRLKQRGVGWMPNSFLGNSSSTSVEGFQKGRPTRDGLLVRLPGMLLPKIGARCPLENVYVGHDGAMLKITVVNPLGFEWTNYCLKSSAILFRYPLGVTESPAPGMVSMKTEGLWVTFENHHQRQNVDYLSVIFGHHVSILVRATDDLPLDTQDLVVSAETRGPRQRWCVG